MAVIEAIKTVYLEADNVQIVNFTSIPQSYQHLQLRISSHDQYDTTNDWIYLRYNSSTGSDYSYHALEGYQASVNNTQGTGKNYGWMAVAAGSWKGVGRPTYSSAVIDILNYSDGVTSTTSFSHSGMTTGSQISSGKTSRPGSCALDNQSAINSIKIYVIYTSPFQRGSSFSLYGINSS